MGKNDKPEKEPTKKELDDADAELDRLARGGRGGDDASEALGDWRDDIRGS